jgi:hypothetical protein
MARKDETLPVRIVKDPFIWGGVGLVIRYHDDYTVKGNFWKAAGALSILGGIAFTVMTQQHDPARLTG